MTTVSQSHIKVVIASDKPGTITLSPNPKTPNVSLFLIGTSARTSIPVSARRHALPTVSVEVDCEKRHREIIVVETRIGPDSFVHLLQVSWKERGPYIDLGKMWVPEGDQFSVQPLPLKGGGCCLRVVVGKGKSLVTYSTHHFPSESEGEVKIAPADLLCQLVSGTRSLSQFKKSLDEVDTTASFFGVVEEKSGAAAEGDIRAELEALRKRNAELEKKTQDDQERIDMLKTRIEGFEKAGLPEALVDMCPQLG